MAQLPPEFITSKQEQQMVKAAVLYEAKKPMPIVDLEQGAPKAGEVRIRMAAAGVCASDHHVMMGETSFPMPIVLGHEGAGIVDEVGEGVTTGAGDDEGDGTGVDAD